MITKDGRDTAIENLTPENYIVPAGEERAYHCVIEVKQFDPKTGKRLSKPRVQKFGKKAFETHVRASLQKTGYDIIILHDPNEWLKDKQAEAAKQAKAAAEAKAKAEQEKFDAAVKAAVDAQVAEAVKKAVADVLAGAEQKPDEGTKKSGRSAK